MTPDTKKLKLCPFCNGNNLKQWANAIACLDCYAHGPEIYVGNIPKALERIMEPGYAGHAWNTRAEVKNE